MSSREVSVWIDERWYKALNHHLKDETLEKRLEDFIDELCNQLPEHEYKRISAEVWQESQENRQAAEAARRIAVFDVTEGGQRELFLVDNGPEFMQMAARLRSYTRNRMGYPDQKLSQFFHCAEPLTQKQFGKYVSERLDNTGRIVGAYEIDLDKGECAALHIMDGWQVFRVKDVCTAAFHAYRKQGLNLNQQWFRFTDKLDGKQLTSALPHLYLCGQQKLRSEDISFSEDIAQNDNLLEFYMDVVFDVDKVFGTHVQDVDNYDWFNVYANYDMDSSQVCDTLEVFLQYNDGSEQEFKYPLTQEEQAIILPKMEEYCRHRLGLTLEQCREEYLNEHQPSQGLTGPQM